MKKIAFAVICMLASFIGNTQPPVLQWAKGAGGGLSDEGCSILTDANGYIYTAGTYNDTADMDPGPGVYNLYSIYSGTFVSKSDAAGNLIWAKSITGTGGCTGVSMKMDATGHFYILGNFSGSCDFDPGAGVFTMSTAIGASAAYICKLDPAGNFVWARGFAETSVSIPTSLALDPAGFIYSAGYFVNTVDLDPGPGVLSYTSQGGFDIYVNKLDTAGNFMWGKSIGGTNEDYCESISLDNAGNIYTTGTFRLTVDFDPGPAVYNLTQNKAVFVWKLDPAGNFGWAKKIGGELNGLALTHDVAGNIYVSGNFMGTVDFDPGGGVFNIASNGRELFFLKLDNQGNFIWAKSIATIGGSMLLFGARTLITDAACNIYATGNFDGQLDFDPGPGTYILNSIGYDMFMNSLDSSGNFRWASRIGGNYSDFGASIHVDQSGYVYTTGYFSHTVDFDPGPAVYNLYGTGGGTYKDFFMQKLAPCVAVTDSITETACASFVFNGQTLTTSGTYYDTLVNMNGCDSLLKLNLTINNPVITTITQSACYSYLFNGQILTSSGTYYDTLSGANGCDSIVTLNLTINAVNVNVTQAAALLTASATGASYQWVQCPSYSILAGENSQSYTANANGDYAVIVTQNGCTDTSVCLTVVGIGIKETEYDTHLIISPNPNNGLFSIELSSEAENASFSVYNITGEVILKQDKLKGRQFTIDISEYASGMYILEINERKLISRVKIIKK